MYRCEILLWLSLDRIYIPMFSLVSFINCNFWHLCRWKRSCLMFELLWHLLIYVIPGGRCFWLLFAYLETVCILNLEMPDCLPMLSKCEWLEKGNIAFCSSRQYSSLSINQSMNCLETLTVTHTDASISVTIVLTFGKQKKAPWEKEIKKRPWQGQPFIWSHQWNCQLPSKQCYYFVTL